MLPHSPGSRPVSWLSFRYRWVSLVLLAQSAGNVPCSKFPPRYLHTQQRPCLSTKQKESGWLCWAFECRQ